MTSYNQFYLCFQEAIYLYNFEVGIKNSMHLLEPVDDWCSHERDGGQA